jgi:hypothetical protein
MKLIIRVISIILPAFFGVSCSTPINSIFTFPTNPPTVIPPMNVNEAEMEIIDFMNMYKIGEEFIRTQETEFSGSICNNYELDIQIIVYSGMRTSKEMQLTPKRIWCYIDKQLIEFNNVEKSIEQHITVIEKYDAEWRPYHLFMYHIEELGSDYLTAKIIFAGYCGPLCGGESRMEIHRVSEKEWEVTEGTVEIISIS